MQPSGAPTWRLSFLWQSPAVLLPTWKLHWSAALHILFHPFWSEPPWSFSFSFLENPDHNIGWNCHLPDLLPSDTGLTAPPAPDLLRGSDTDNSSPVLLGILLHRFHLSAHGILQNWSVFYNMSLQIKVSFYPVHTGCCKVLYILPLPPVLIHFSPDNARKAPFS